MTPQEKILEALGDRAMTGRALYQALSGENPAQVDIALSQLLKRGVVTFELGHYEKARRRVPAQPAAPAPAASNQRPVAAVKASVSQPTRRPPIEKPVAPVPKAEKPAASGAAALTAREREVLELVGRGMTSKMIGDQLRTQKGSVDYWRWNACRKLGLRGKAELIAWLRKNPVSSSAAPTKPAPVAAHVLLAAPSREGTEGATAGAASIEVEKREVRSSAPRYSPDLRTRLIQVQQAKAEELLWLQKLVDTAREQLRSVEEMVRIVTEASRT